MVSKLEGVHILMKYLAMHFHATQILFIDGISSIENCFIIQIVTMAIDFSLLKT